MFSTEEFIKASRRFVCVRLETYESKDHEELIRSLLNGRYANTAFVVLDPDGKTKLTRASRTASAVLGATGRGPGAKAESNEDVIAAMNGIADKYQTKGDPSDAVLQDFHSFRQALNVASGDQRLLVYVVDERNHGQELAKKLRPVFSDADVIGVFHLDFHSGESDKDWSAEIEGASEGKGIHVIHSGKFGQSGKQVASLPLDADVEAIEASLLKANAEFAGEETRKVYSRHVQEGRRNNIEFETAIPFGEDRDGDGKIDSKGRKGKGKGKGRNNI